MRITLGYRTATGRAHPLEELPYASTQVHNPRVAWTTVQDLMREIAQRRAAEAAMAVAVHD